MESENISSEHGNTVSPSKNEIKIVSDQGVVSLVEHWYEDGILVIKIEIKNND
jgi:hypothetical protein